MVNMAPAKVASRKQRLLTAALKDASVPSYPYMFDQRGVPGMSGGFENGINVNIQSNEQSNGGHNGCHFYQTPSPSNFPPLLHPIFNVPGNHNQMSVSSPFPSLFPLRDRTNIPIPIPTPTPPVPNNLLRSILRDSEQTMTEYQSYRQNAEIQLKEKDKTVQRLRGTLQSCEEKLLETKLQNEAYASRESLIFRDIQENIRVLLNKLEVIEHSKVEASIIPPNPPSLEVESTENDEEVKLTLNELMVKVESLENRVLKIEKNGEDLLETCKSTEETFKNCMDLVNQKLEQIVGLVTVEKQEFCMATPSNSMFKPICPFDQVSDNNVDNDEEQFIVPDIPENYLTHEEDRQEQNSFELSMTNMPVEVIMKSADCSPSHQTSSKTFLEGSSSQAKKQVREACREEKKSFKKQFKQKGERWTSKLLKKFAFKKKKLEQKEDKSQKEPKRDRNCDCDEDEEEIPPILTLPCRIVKDTTRRLQAMPILLPEYDPTGPRPHYDFHLNEQRKTESHMQPVLSQQQLNRKLDFEKKRKQRNFVLRLKEVCKTENSADYFESQSYNTGVEQMANEGARRVVVGIKNEKDCSISGLNHIRDFTKAGFACLCGAKFTGAGGLYVHQVKNMENEKFSCTLCGKRFHYFSGLKAHRKSTHKMEFTTEVGCSRCGQVFDSKKHRQGHRDARGRTCWLSGSYQSKNWKVIRSTRVQKDLPEDCSSPPEFIKKN